MFGQTCSSLLWSCTVLVVKGIPKYIFGVSTLNNKHTRNVWTNLMFGQTCSSLLWSCTVLVVMGIPKYIFGVSTLNNKHTRNAPGC